MSASHDEVNAQAVIRTLTAALKETRMSMRELASEAGDASEWNEDGHAYEACRSADAALALADKAVTGAPVAATKLVLSVSDGVLRRAWADGDIAIQLFDHDMLDEATQKAHEVACATACEALTEVRVTCVEPVEQAFDADDDENDDREGMKP